MEKISVQILEDWLVMKHEDEFPTLTAEVKRQNKISNSSWYRLTPEANAEWVKFQVKYYN